MEIDPAEVNSLRERRRSRKSGPAFPRISNAYDMKRYLPFLCGLLLAACSSEFEEEAGAVRGGRAVELTGVSGSSTRTSAGAVDGAAIPFLWSADDRIWVNGVQSSEAGTAGAAASFGFSELTGEAPYEVYYNMTGEGARAVVPSRQNQAAAGELQLGANGDFGYATTDAGGHFTLSHATSYIWFDPWSQEVDARLVSVSLATGRPDDRALRHAHIRRRRIRCRDRRGICRYAVVRRGGRRAACVRRRYAGVRRGGGLSGGLQRDGGACDLYVRGRQRLHRNPPRPEVGGRRDLPPDLRDHETCRRRVGDRGGRGRTTSPCV